MQSKDFAPLLSPLFSQCFCELFLKKEICVHVLWRRSGRLKRSRADLAIMGVSCVHSLSIPAGKGGQQVIESISRQLESFGATKCGQFYVECDSYLSVNHMTGQTSDAIDNTVGAGGQTSRVLNVYHSSEYPMSCFALLDTGSSLVADSTFDAIVMNLSAIYSNKKGIRIDCRGQKWSLSDFSVRIGTCSLGTQLKGVLLEVEYKPSVVAIHCWDLIKELAQSLCGSGLSDTNQWMCSRMNQIYSPIDTIQQYNQHFNQLRRAQTTASIPAAISTNTSNAPTPQAVAK